MHLIFSIGKMGTLFWTIYEILPSLNVGETGSILFLARLNLETRQLDFDRRKLATDGWTVRRTGASLAGRSCCMLICVFVLSCPIGIGTKTLVFLLLA